VEIRERVASRHKIRDRVGLNGLHGNKAKLSFSNGNNRFSHLLRCHNVTASVVEDYFLQKLSQLNNFLMNFP